MQIESGMKENLIRFSTENPCFVENKSGKYGSIRKNYAKCREKGLLSKKIPPKQLLHSGFSRNCGKLGGKCEKFWGKTLSKSKKLGKSNGFSAFFWIIRGGICFPPLGKTRWKKRKTRNMTYKSMFRVLLFA